MCPDFVKRDTNIVFFGTAEFAVPILERLAASNFRPFLVVSTPDRPAGRGRDVKSPPVKLAAERLGIPVIQPEKLEIRNLKLEIPDADLFIVAAYGKILPSGLLAIPKFGSLNVHPSLLPRWRGPAPVQFTILNGDDETGVTIILMDEKVDHGPILRNSKFPAYAPVATGASAGRQIPNSKMTAPELTAQLAEMGAEMLLEVIPEWVRGKIEPRPQDDSEATFSRMLSKEDGRINWLRPAEEIERMVRAFKPWPGTYSFWQRDSNRVRLSIETAEAENGVSVDGPAPGKVLGLTDRLKIATGKGVLIVGGLKPEGGNIMSGADFLRGHKKILGAVLD